MWHQLVFLPDCLSTGTEHGDAQEENGESQEAPRSPHGFGLRQSSGALSLPAVGKAPEDWRSPKRFANRASCAVIGKRLGFADLFPGLPGLAGGPSAGQGHHAPERLLRPHARVLPGVQRRLCEVLAGQGRRHGDGPAVSRRVRQAGAGGHRRTAGRRGDAGAGIRHRCDCRKRQTAPSGLAGAPALPQLALHLGHRVPGPQGQSQGHQRLGRPGPAWRVGHHAQPQGLRGRPLELPGGLGFCLEAIRPGPGQGARVRGPAL